MTPNRREFEKQCAFQKFCKSVLHNEACNAHEEIRRRRVREVTFSNLALHEERQLYTVDKYFQDEEAEPSYQMAGKEITPNLTISKPEASKHELSPSYFSPTQKDRYNKSRDPDRPPWLLSVDLEHNELKQEIPIIQNKKYTAEFKINIILTSIVMSFYIQSGRRTFTSIVPLSDLPTAKESRIQKGRDAFASRPFSMRRTMGRRALAMSHRLLLS